MIYGLRKAITIIRALHSLSCSDIGRGGNTLVITFYLVLNVGTTVTNSSIHDRCYSMKKKRRQCSIQQYKNVLRKINTIHIYVSNSSKFFLFRQVKKCEQHINFLFVVTKTITVDSRPFPVEHELKQLINYRIHILPKQHC